MNEFDFLTGTWDVINRRRMNYLDEASAWEEFPATTHGSRHFDGSANFDEITFITLGVRGLTLRLYDHEHGEWSLTVCHVCLETNGVTIRRRLPCSKTTWRERWAAAPHAFKPSHSN